MASDRARVSYDATRRYRSVVAQQGRVTLEADVNEAQTIAEEELRQETLHIVGPAGTPDNGYEISLPAASDGPPFDFHVGPGTMYVGGVRAWQPTGFNYSQQPDWLDHDGDPLWVDPGRPVNPDQLFELVALLLREQEVSAVEDQPLREVALGGPDTTQRTRLIQRIIRVGVTERDCAGAEKTAADRWQQQGAVFDPQTMRLNSPARLQVQFAQQPPPESRCDPQVQGGYLGADNQLIRVQITGFDAESGQGRFVWAFNDASFLYRVTAVDAQTLELQTSPVDSYHAPGINRAVEVLRSAVDLGDDNWIAEHTGVVMTPTQAFVPETRRLPLPSALPAEYTGDTHPLFLRLWEGEVPFTPGVPADLPGTGVQVIITLGEFTGPFTVGQYWMFAVRPSTPVRLYPERYLEAPQPPEGPRLWVCPLAVIPPRRNGSPVQDCRKIFDNLVDLTARKAGGGCCTVTLSPADLAGTSLQAILDQFTPQDSVTVCLMPGVYTLPSSLNLGQQHANLTIEACHSGAIIEAGPEEDVLHGLMVINADNVTLRGLEFQLSLVSLLKDPNANDVLAGLSRDILENLLQGPLVEEVQVALGIRVIECSNLRVEDCTFNFQESDAVTFEVGILSSGTCQGLTLRNNRFLHNGAAIAVTPSFEMRVGYLQAPATVIQQITQQETPPDVIQAGVTGGLLPSVLEDAAFRGNEFAGLSAAALIYAETGAVWFQDNTVRDCYAGFWLLSLRSIALPLPLTLTQSPTVTALLTDPVIVIGSVLARAYPLPPALAPALAPTLLPAHDPNVTLQTFDGLLQRYGRLNSVLSALEASAFSKPISPASLSLHVSNNEIRATAPGPQADSGSGFVVWDDPQNSNSEALVSANLIESSTSFVEGLLPVPVSAVAMIAMVSRCAITGNMILNESASRPAGSLILSPTPLTSGGATGDLVAVTGNVFRGPAGLPPRSLAAPFNAWDGFNTTLHS